MPSVRVRENEYFDAALRRFKRACEKAGVLTELRRREFYEKPTQERKRKKAAAVLAPFEAPVAREHAWHRPAFQPASRRSVAPFLLGTQGQFRKDVSKRANH